MKEGYSNAETHLRDEQETGYRHRTAEIIPGADRVRDRLLRSERGRKRSDERAWTLLEGLGSRLASEEQQQRIESQRRRRTAAVQTAHTVLPSLPSPSDPSSREEGSIGGCDWIGTLRSKTRIWSGDAMCASLSPISELHPDLAAVRP